MVPACVVVEEYEEDGEDEEPTDVLREGIIQHIYARSDGSVMFGRTRLTL